MSAHTLLAYYVAVAAAVPAGGSQSPVARLRMPALESMAQRWVTNVLSAFSQVLNVCLRVVGRRDVQDRLRPELCHDHLPPQPGVELLRLPSQPDPLSKGSLITLGR